MDPTTLVSKEQVAGGRKLLERLSATPLRPIAALWAQKTEQDSQPYLYIVTPYVETKGAIEAYRILGSVRRELDSTTSEPLEKIDPFSVKLIGPSDPLAQGVLEWNRSHPDEYPTRHCGAGLGSVSIDGAYSYPAKMFAASPAQPQSA